MADWCYLINESEVKRMTRQYIGARYVPMIFADENGDSQWRDNIPYEALTIVTNLGNSYTSRKPVPVGVQIDNAEYWVLTGNYNAQLSEIATNVAKMQEEFEKIEPKLKIYTSEYDTFDEVIDDYNASNYGMIIINSDIELNNSKEINKSCTIYGNYGNKLTLKGNLKIKNNTSIINSYILIDGGSIILNGSGVKILCNNIHFTTSTSNRGIVIERTNDFLINGNTFISDTAELSNQNNIAIYYEQNTDNEWMNGSISENNFSKFATFIRVVVTDSTRITYCAGIRVTNNTFISGYDGLLLDGTDHWKINDNIIDYNERPIKITNINGLRIENNYIFSAVNNSKCVHLLKGVSTCESVLLKDNYISNNNTSRINTYGIYLDGDITGVDISSNFIRMMSEGLHISGNISGLHINTNTFAYCIKAGYIDASNTYNGYYTDNTVDVTTSQDFENKSVLTTYMTGQRATGSFSVTVPDNSYRDVVISYNFPTIPTIIVESVGNEAISLYRWTVLTSGNTSATIRIYHIGVGAAVELGYKWLAIA